MNKAKITDLEFDNLNFNKGTNFGKSLMNKSLSKFGAGRSILIDKNNRIIAGNKTAEEFAEIGLENIQIVETDGKTLIAVRRNDIDLDSPEGREFALADNQTAKTNIDFDFELIETEIDKETQIEWGFDFESQPDYSILENNEDIDTQLSQMTSGVKKAIQIEFENEHYNEAFELVKFWREQGLYIGGFIIEKLKSEKERL